MTCYVSNFQTCGNSKVIFQAEKTDGGNAFNGEIKFNNITLNIGNAIDQEGVFRAPMDGTYRFSFSAATGFEKYALNAEVLVYQNGTYKFSIVDSNNEGWSDGNNLSYSWIWSMTEGETVTFGVSVLADGIIPQLLAAGLDQLDLLSQFAKDGIQEGESFLRADTSVPVIFTGELVYAEE